MREQSTLPVLLSFHDSGACAECGKRLSWRTRAWWFRAERKLVCTACLPVTASVSGGGAKVIDLAERRHRARGAAN